MSRPVSKKASKPVLDDADKALKARASQFVSKHGMVALLDVCLGALNKLLVIKGILTSVELREAYSEMLSKAMPIEAKSQKAPAKKASSRGRCVLGGCHKPVRRIPATGLVDTFIQCSKCGTRL